MGSRSTAPGLSLMPCPDGTRAVPALPGGASAVGHACLAGLAAHRLGGRPALPGAAPDLPAAGRRGQPRLARRHQQRQGGSAEVA